MWILSRVNPINVTLNEANYFDILIAEKAKSELDKLQEQRDYKRRRQKYRAKNVHITKKTPTATARDIINTRMEELGVDLDGNGMKEEEEELPPPPPPVEKREYYRPPPPSYDHRKRHHEDDRRQDYERRDHRHR
jgi:hypothetical protein